MLLKLASVSPNPLHFINIFFTFFYIFEPLNDYSSKTKRYKNSVFTETFPSTFSKK